MIVGFADRATEQVYHEQKPRELPPEILKRALAKLQQLNASARLDDLRIPPGNRLEALQGDRRGQYSIRINDQWRICFVWQEDNNASQVQIADYH